MAKPVVIQSFLNSGDAYFAKTLLEDAEIPVFLYDENASGATVAYSFATGGIKIAVPDHYVDDAVKIIDEYFKGLKEDSDIEDIPELSSCPKCNSRQIYTRKAKSALTLILFVLVGLIAFKNPKKRKYTCRNCRYNWWSY